MKLLRTSLLALTTALMDFTVGLYGWSDGPKPEGFKPTAYRYWKRMTNGSIASASLTEAFTACVLEGKLKP